tara:strand:- start:1103 stop:1348 length:246 start_codon:yes stop_codon:yes gene_type:complete
MNVQPSPSISVLGKNMELIALKKGLSLAYIAEEGGLSFRALKNLRDGYCRYIDPDLLEGLMRVLKVTPNELLLPLDDVKYD